ncbi:MAG: hypothetical protein DWQ02_24345 [Bacteroidetes bacterium]|nr:MAG: hypothetical protein DWQ02_24345 [Bacteroidota bacterium]
MKLRCATNSIRLRVRKSEVESLKKGHKLIEKVNFGSAVFTFSLGPTNTPNVLTVFEGGQLSVHIPLQQMTEWLNGDDVGIEVEKNFNGGETLKILIEKDFPCVTRTAEDKADTFQELADKNNQVC